MADPDKNNIVVLDDSEASDEYYTLGSSWIEIPCYKSGEFRLGIHRENAYKQVRLFATKNNDAKVIILENNYMLFDRKNWMELRKKRGIDKFKPLSADKNGTIWIGDNYNGANFRVYIKR
jgi:hypothetical protein